MGDQHRTGRCAGTGYAALVAANSFSKAARKVSPEGGGIGGCLNSTFVVDFSTFP
jgi:hypothetical protein